ncbi:MAG: histidinol-phosphate transaminase [Xanthomonadales bacterium]|nr:histidinol-phosphate transaminase [Xanthomonadales bacterium]
MSSNDSISSLAVPSVSELQAYQPGKPISDLEREYGVSNIIKLASNENPVGASPAALSAMQETLSDMALYPDGGGFELKGALSVLHDIDPACITLGNGSNDVLVLLAEAFLQPGCEAVYSQYCFAVYPLVTHATGATGIEVPALDDDKAQAMGHDLDAMRAHIGPNTRMVFIANPNNPTGTWIEEGPLEAFIASLPEHVLVIVDEAYHEYSALLGVPDVSKWLARYPRLVVTRTFSKAYGLAGIRVGYSLSSPEVARLINKIRQPFNVNSLALSGATAALKDQAFIAESVRVNSLGIEQIQADCEVLGIATLPSAGNFILADMGRPAKPVYEALLGAGIIVRPVANYGLDRHLRISVGTQLQNSKLMAALGKIFRECGADTA